VRLSRGFKPNADDVRIVVLRLRVVRRKSRFAECGREVENGSPTLKTVDIYQSNIRFYEQLSHLKSLETFIVWFAPMNQC